MKIFKQLFRRNAKSKTSVPVKKLTEQQRIRLALEAQNTEYDFGHNVRHV